MKTETQNRRFGKSFPGLLFTLIGIATLLLAACQQIGVPNTGGSKPQAQPGSQSVNLVNTSFDPQQITVKVGTTVVWTNKDNMVHTVTADDNSFASSNLNPGDTFKFTFSKAGTYHYYCKFHGGPNGQGMSGTIIVTGS